MGLVLQDLSQGLSMTQQKKVMGLAAAKFRHAIRQRPDFHRAAYNLGTVYYAHAAAQGHHQVIACLRCHCLNTIVLPCDHVDKSFVKLLAVSKVRDVLTKHPEQWPSKNGPTQMLDASVQSLFQMAAQYVCLAFALEPFKEVYQRSLDVVRAQLPLPFLRSGYLLSVRPDTIGKVQVMRMPLFTK